MSSPHWWSYANRTVTTLMPWQLTKKIDHSITESCNNIQPDTSVLWLSSGYISVFMRFNSNRSVSQKHCVEHNCKNYIVLPLTSRVCEWVLLYRYKQSLSVFFYSPSARSFSDYTSLSLSFFPHFVSSLDHLFLYPFLLPSYSHSPSASGFGRQAKTGPSCSVSLSLPPLLTLWI